MHRFFIDELPKDKNISIKGKDAKHIKDVLRMKIGDSVELVCEPKKFICEIEKLNENSVDLKIIETTNISNEPKLKINLFQAIPKSTKMELIIQKCTEVGVVSFTPVITSRTIVKINDIKKEIKKLTRWQNIAYEAAKQSKRDIVPKVNTIIDFNEALNQFKNNITIVPYENENIEDLHSVRENYVNANEINVFIGPEGGFADEEIEKLKKIDAITVSLGARILRTETAGIVISTILLYETNDLGVIKWKE